MCAPIPLSKFLKRTWPWAQWVVLAIIILILIGAILLVVHYGSPVS